MTVNSIRQMGGEKREGELLGLLFSFLFWDEQLWIFLGHIVGYIYKLITFFLFLFKTAISMVFKIIMY